MSSTHADDDLKGVKPSSQLQSIFSELDQIKQTLKKQGKDIEAIRKEKEKTGNKFEVVENMCRPFRITDDALLQVEGKLRRSIDKGLQTEKVNNVQCFPSYVTMLPTGNESGLHFVVDFGAPGFRLLVTDFQRVTEEGHYKGTEAEKIKNGDQDLFDYIAESMWDFINQRQPLVKRIKKEKELKCTFIFGFPVKQENLKSGKLVKWTKGFNIEGVQGCDIKELLESSIKKIPELHELNIDIVAFVSNVTALLCGGIETNAKCKIGLILGAGINASYLENIDEIRTINRRSAKIPNSAEEMVINTELGSFGDNKELDFLRTQWDISLDEETHDAGSQIFEKMISKQHMGEIIRRVLLTLVDKKLIFLSRSHETLRKVGSFPIEYVCKVEEDPIGKYGRTITVLNNLGIDDVLDEDCKIVRYVCQCVSIRAAKLISAACVALLNKIGDKDVKIAVYGDLYHLHPYLGSNIESKVKHLMGTDTKVELLDQDTGIGGALIAANLE